MKKSLLILTALSLAALPFLFSCNKPDNGGEDVVEVVMPEPPTADAAIKIDFPASNPPTYADTKGEYEILSIEFTEANRYILTRKVIATKANVGDTEVVIGSYTENNGSYQCQGESFSGQVNVGASSSGSGSDTKVDVKPSGEENQGKDYSGDAKVTETPAPSSGDQSNAVRNWQVNKVLISVKGKGLDISAPFTNGCDLKEIASWAANNGVSGLKDRLSEFDGYKVKEVSFTGANTVTITFTGANTKAVNGNYSMNTTSKTITFSLTEGNAFFHGSVSGSYEYPNDKTMNLVLNTTVEGYNCTMEMNMTRL